MSLLDELARIAEVESSGIVTGAQAIEPKRRLFLADASPHHLYDGSYDRVSPEYACRAGR